MHTDFASATSLLEASGQNESSQQQFNNNSAWHLWCRLCAKEDPRANISVFFKDEQQDVSNKDTSLCSAEGTPDMSLAAAIEKYFWIQIKRVDVLPQMLCTECFSLVTSLVNFSERVTKVQQLFCHLHNTELTEPRTVDLRAMRLKYGLLDEEREQVFLMQQQQLPEVHYFESKPKINDLEERIFGNEAIMTATTTTAATTTQTNPLAQQQPRIKIKIKKENIVDDVSAEDEDDDDDVDAENTLNDVEEEVVEEEAELSNVEDDSDDDSDNDDDDCDDSEDSEQKFIEQPQLKTQKKSNSPIKSIILRTRKKQNLQETIEEDSMKEEPPPPKKRRRRRKQKQKAISTDNVNKLDFNDKTTKAETLKLENTDNYYNDDDEDDDAGAEADAGDIMRYACNDCPRKFKRIYHLRQHMKRAHALSGQQLPTFSCTQCVKKFTTPRQLDTHARIHLPPEQRKIVPCPYCEKRFCSHTLMQTHIKYVHMNERPFICEECGVAVRTNAALKTHMLTHTDYAPFVCDICKKGFKNQIRLKNHLETHDPNKHICAECGLQLNSRATLNRHLLVHSDEMQHKCDYCGRAFKRAKALKSHLILHTGLKPYSCDFCDRTFANGSNCRSHKKKAHAVELAAFEAAGGVRTYTRNIPKLDALKAVTKAADNLAPVVSKQSGRFAFGKKPKVPTQDQSSPEQRNNNNNNNNSDNNNNINNNNDIITVQNIQMSNETSPPSNVFMLSHISETATKTTSNNAQQLNVLQSSLPLTPTAAAAATTLAHNTSPPASIPNINNIYNHIMKQASIAVVAQHTVSNNELSTIQIKRPDSQSSSSCIAIEQDAGNIEMSTSTTLQPMSTATTSALTAMPSHLYAQIIKQNMLQQQEQQLQQHQQMPQQQQHLHHHHHPHPHLQPHQTTTTHLVGSIRSPESQTSSQMTDNQSNAVTSVQFYNQIRQNLPGPYL